MYKPVDYNFEFSFTDDPLKHKGSHDASIISSNKLMRQFSEHEHFLPRGSIINMSNEIKHSSVDQRRKKTSLNKNIDKDALSEDQLSTDRDRGNIQAQNLNDQISAIHSKQIKNVKT